MKHKLSYSLLQILEYSIFYEYLSKGFITTLMVHLVSDVWTFPILLLHDFSPVITVFRDLPLIQELCFLQSRLCVLISSSNLLCDFCVQSSFPRDLLFSLIQERLSKGFYLNKAFGSPLLVNTQAYLAVFYL